MAAAMLSAITLALAGCILTPGKFTSALDVRKDGKFTYSYNGEIHLLALTRLAEMGGSAEANAPFEAESCHDDDYKEKICSDEELATRLAALAGTDKGGRGGYQRLYVDHVLQADDGCDFDFLVGCRGAAVPRHSH